MRKSLWSITWPIFIDIGLRTLFAFLSYWMVSRVSDHAASILAITNSCILIGFILAENLAQTSAILIAQQLGGQSARNISSTYVATIIISSAFGLLASVVFLGFSGQIFILFRPEAEVLAQGSHYLSIVGSGFIVYSLSYALIHILNSNGHTTYALLNSLLTNGLGLTAGFVIVMGKHDSSAEVLDLLAKSNLIARVIGFAFLCFVCARVLRHFEWAKVLWSQVKESLSQIARLGTSNVLDVLSAQLFQVVLLGIIAVTGVHGVAARSYVASLTAIFEIPSMSVARGNQILLGHAIGAGALDRARAQLRQALVLSTVLAAVGLVLGLLFQERLLGVFTRDPQTVALGLQIFDVALALSILKCASTTVAWALKSAGDVRFCVRLSTLTMWCVAIPVVYLALERFHLGLRAAWLLLAADELLRLFFLLRRWRGGAWQRIDLVSRLEPPRGEVLASPRSA